MLNRSLQVKVVKNDKKTADDIGTPQADFEGRAIIIASSVGRGIRNVCLAVCLYVVVDTLRQVSVTYAKK